MLRTIFIILFTFLTLSIFSQENQGSLEKFLSDTSLAHASVSIYIADPENGEVLSEYNSAKSLVPASVMKLITSAAALELLGSSYTFKTTIGYTGKFNKKSGKLKGDIVITGGGDPALGSEYFADHYQNFSDKWVTEIINMGIKKIEGKVITDDSYYDFQPVPAKWLWEDIGNYYGAGVYGLSVFDNTYKIHLKTISDNSHVTITGIVPAECSPILSNQLIASGTTEEGIVYATPYWKYGWLTGTIPTNTDDYVLDASITDPPQLIAEILTNKLEDEGMFIYDYPSTVRLEHKSVAGKVIPIIETVSPPLSDIIKVLNHESVNLYAEHLTKELGKKYKNNGSTASGIEVVIDFLKNAGIKTDGFFIEDGSGLSPSNSINTSELVRLLMYMQNHGKYFPEYFSSLPEAGKNGTLKNYFTDTAFESRFRAKSGSMTRVRSYAGYLTTQSGRKLAFGIIMNNFSGTSQSTIPLIEEYIKEIILKN